MFTFIMLVVEMIAVARPFAAEQYLMVVTADMLVSGVVYLVWEHRLAAETRRASRQAAELYRASIKK